MIFFVWGRGECSRVGCFLKVEPTWFVEVIRLCIPSTCTLRVIVFYIMGPWRSTLDYAVNTCGKKKNMFTICILSWIKQIPGDNKHRRDSCLVDVQAGAHQTVFPSQPEAKDTTSLLLSLVVYLGQMHLQPTVPWIKLFKRLRTTITIRPDQNTYKSAGNLTGKELNSRKVLTLQAFAGWKNKIKKNKKAAHTKKKKTPHTFYLLLNEASVAQHYFLNPGSLCLLKMWVSQKCNNKQACRSVLEIYFTGQ